MSEFIQGVAHRSWQSANKRRYGTAVLSQQLAFRVGQDARKIVSFIRQCGERGAYDGLCRFVDAGDHAVPNHFQGDGIKSTHDGLLVGR